MTAAEKKAAEAQEAANKEAEHTYDLERFHGPGPIENTLDWVTNIWKVGKPIYDAYRPKLCEECTMDPWIVMRRLKQIMDCKINCQPPYLFKPSKSGPPRPEQAIGQTFPNNKPIPYDPDNIEIKKKMHEEDLAAKALDGTKASDPDMKKAIEAAMEEKAHQEFVAEKAAEKAAEDAKVVQEDVLSKIKKSMFGTGTTPGNAA